MDDFPVNHLKDDFLWDGLEDEFQEKLKSAAQDYVDFAQTYRHKDQKSRSAVVLATNDELAQELTEEQMLERLTIAEVGAVADEADYAVRDGEGGDAARPEARTEDHRGGQFVSGSSTPRGWRRPSRTSSGSQRKRARSTFS